MKPWHAPSGRQRGIPFVLPDDWSPEQALAVFELLDDLRERIWQHYRIPLHALIRDQRITNTTAIDDTDDTPSDLPPF